MKLIEDSGRLARVEIDGTVWYMSSEEYRTMARKPFHFWPYRLKKLNPQPRSCARCLNRPIDFCSSNKRPINEPQWMYKPGVTQIQIYDAFMKDCLTGTQDNEDKLKIFRKCPNWSWSRAAPFYNNSECKAGEWQ